MLATPTGAGVVFRTEMTQGFHFAGFTYRYWYPVAATADHASLTR